MLHLITDIKLELEGIGWATVSLYWNSKSEIYHVESQGQWPENWATAKGSHAQNRSYAWGYYSGRVHEFMEKGMSPVHTEWR